MGMIARELTDDSLRAFLDAFYNKVRHDPEIGLVFAAVIAEEAWPAHLAKIHDFWSSLLFKTGRYKGNPFAAHIGKSIRRSHFLRWLALFDETAVESFGPRIADALSERAHLIGESLRAGQGRHARRCPRGRRSSEEEWLELAPALAMR